MANKQKAAEAAETQTSAPPAAALERVIAVTAIMHDGATVAPGEELELPPKQAAALLECGAARPVTPEAEG